MTKFAWHVHHNTLLEPLTKPMAHRRAYILEVKPKNEHALRLRLLKPIRGVLPLAVVKADIARAATWATFKKIRDSFGTSPAYDRAGLACDRAIENYIKALTDNRAKIEALHAQECPNCPWNGKTIFAREIEK